MAADGNCSGHGANGPGCFVCPGVDCGQPVAVARISLDSVVCRCVLPWLWWKSLDFRHGDQLLQDRAGPGRTAYGNGASGCDWQRVHQSLLHANQREHGIPGTGRDVGYIGHLAFLGQQSSADDFWSCVWWWYWRSRWNWKLRCGCGSWGGGDGGQYGNWRRCPGR